MFRLSPEIRRPSTPILPTAAGAILTGRIGRALPRDAATGRQSAAAAPAATSRHAAAVTVRHQLRAAGRGRRGVQLELVVGWI